MDNLKQLAFGRKNAMRLLMAGATVKGLAMVGQALFFVLVADAVFLQDRSFTDILPLLGGLFAAILLRVLSGYIIARTGINLAAAVKTDLRTKLIRSFADSPLQASIHGQSGRKVSLLLDAVDETDGFFSVYIPQLIQSYIIPVILLAVIFFLHWPTGVIILLTAPFIPVFMAIVGKRTKEKADRQMEELSHFSGNFLDVLQGLTSLRLYGKTAEQKDSIRQNSLKFRDATMDVLKSAFLSSLALEYISMLSIGIIALEIGMRLIAFESITFFTAFFVMVLVPEFFALLKEFGSAFHTARGSLAAAGQFEAVFNETERPVAWGTESLSGTPPHISLAGASFQYGEGFTLQPVDAEIPPHSQVAIIGESGSGKTTLLHLIAGLLPPAAGTVMLNGMPREQIGEDAWFDELSYISQDPYLFAGTIEENIAIGASRETSRAEVAAAAEKAGIGELVQSLSQGFDTPVGEGGRGLSGGEKQRIALARAFLKKPSVILFDEPTTGLDLHTERVLQASLAELGKSATVITVAHRLHTIRQADVILYLSGGELLAAGSHEELMGHFIPYSEMAAVQQGGGVR
ncbi:thiol reductant ABC exporter subunit CydD [Planococcus lenghuensis]|uniref:Thiol reductant ABC exporter subunit CydD n=1 Tax=Planococcus lenghuensis TaxID=2213202 RepID=A0A1Q2L2B1_9BACL|nr:thiol reductant ABC exporter subunit CydD [Planococcus lenghuensis]AQQ54600.1 thiol reductant ABC exporter subunit CydD [Planococcus lenghuensis]